MSIKRRLVVAAVIGVLIALTPLIVKVIEWNISTTANLGTRSITKALTSSITTSLESGIRVSVSGCGESHRGEDYLIVCPKEVTVSKPGAIVTINATVKFKHAQPCPHSSWKIIAANLNNAEIVSEGKTELIDPFTAIKEFKVKVLGNGGLDIIYVYGSGCPYGTQEIVHVEFKVTG